MWWTTYRAWVDMGVPKGSSLIAFLLFIELAIDGICINYNVRLFTMLIGLLLFAR
jgi:hypothetical protein